MSGQRRTNQYLRSDRSVSGDGVVTTTYADDSIAAGYAYTVNNVQPLSGSASLVFALTPSADYFYFIPPLEIESSETVVYATVYESPSISGGTPVTPINRNRFSSNTFNGALVVAPTVTATGTQLLRNAAFASSNFFSTSSGSAGGSKPLILDSTKQYLVVIENQEAGATIIDYESILYELPSAEGVSD